ncbi:MAG: HD domain-containing protein [Cyanobacteria bacterium]|nr:HD domain-containing protein [Cyanobacteriota bacterium]MDA0865914.1 HD domain-containing protein [Cyanobacteriota bacterium]
MDSSVPEQGVNDPWSVVVTALQFAADRHCHQRRKDKAASPYINHPIALLHLLHQEAGVIDPVVLASALLHDTVEDTDTSLAELETRFGPEIAGVVAQVTDDKSLPKAVRKQHQVDHASSLCDRAKLVKLADKTANLRDLVASPPAGWSVTRCQDYCRWAKQVVDELRGTHQTLEAQFDQVYGEAISQMAA